MTGLRKKSDIQEASSIPYRSREMWREVEGQCHCSATLPEFVSTVGTEKEAMVVIDIACFSKQARVFAVKSVRT
jgi:hypothetical protein